MTIRVCALALLLPLSTGGCALAVIGVALNAAGATNEHNPGFDRDRPPAVDTASWVKKAN